MKATWGSIWLLPLATGLLSACDGWKVKPVEVSGQPVVGHWYQEILQEGLAGPEYRRLYLQIREDGYARYHHQLCEYNGDHEVMIERKLELDYTPIKRLSEKKMLMQNYPLTPKFELTLGQWPDRNEQKQFEVDALKLDRLRENELPSLVNWTCPDNPAALETAITKAIPADDVK